MNFYIKIWALFIFACLEISKSQPISKESYTLNSWHFDYLGPYDYKACEKIVLKPGFYFKATQIPSLNLTSTLTLKVNEYYNCGLNYNLPQSFNPNVTTPIPFDYTKDVGKTEYQYAVDEMGNFFIDVPIFTPPGINGVQPALNLRYNSGKGKGLCGFGWNISVESKISRSPKNFYYHDQIETLKADASDPFSYDGRVMYPLTGSNGGNGVIYGLEQEDYSIIKSFGNNGPDYFVVQTKDGITKEYGTDVNARLTLSGVNYEWYLNKVIDPFGNYWAIKYKNFGENQILPEIIEYTGNANAGILPVNKIKLIYRESDFRKKYFMNGHLISGSKVLAKIQVYSEEKLMREYVLHFSYNDAVYQITESNGEGKSLNSFKCFYQDVSHILMEPQPAGINTYTFNAPTPFFNNKNISIQTSVLPNNANSLYLDLNDDGFIDFFNIVNVPTTNSLTLKYLLKKYLNDGNGMFNFLSDDTLYINNVLLSNMDFPYNVKNKTIFLDLNSDGAEDASIVNSPLNSIYGYTLNGQVIPLIQENGNIIQKTPTTFLISGPVNHTYGDFDGDGKVELCVLNSKGLQILKYNPDKNYQFFDNYYNINWNLENNPYPQNVNNVNAIQADFDQKQELIFSFGSNIYVLSFNVAVNNGSFQITGHNLKTKNSPPPQHAEFYYGDFNGDGLTDFISKENPPYTPVGPPYQYTLVPEKNYWKISYSTGNGNFDFHTISINSNSYYHLEPNTNDTIVIVPLNNNLNYVKSVITSSNHFFYGVMDIDNDGIDEFMEGYGGFNLSASSSVNPVFTITNVTPTYLEFFNFKNPADAHQPPELYVHQFQNCIIFNSPPFDFNNDGKNEIFCNYYFNNQTFSQSLGVPSKGYLTFKQHYRIGQIFDGYSKKTQVEYNSPSGLLKQYPSRFSKAPPYNFSSGYNDVITFIPRFNVVSKIHHDNLINVLEELYSYEGPMIHLKGKGFLGFSSITVSNTTTGDISSKTFSDPTQNPYFVRLNTVSNQYKGIPGFPVTSPTLVSSQTITSSFDINFLFGNYNNKRFSLTFPQTTSIDFINPKKNTTSILKDMYGNVFSLTQSVFDANNQMVESITETFTYAPLPVFHPTIPVRPIHHEFTASRLNQLPFTRNTSYSYSPVAPFALMSKTDVQSGINENYLYDAVGNIIQSSLSGPTLGNQYLINQVQYEPTKRFPIKKINPLGHITQYTFDPAYGNILEEKDPNGLISTYTYDNWGRMKTQTAPDALTASVSVGWAPVDYPNVPNAFYYVKKEHPLSKTKITFFDKLGREVRISEYLKPDPYIVPYTNQAVEKYIHKGYDAQGRLFDVADNFGNFTHYFFDDLGRTNTVTSSNGSSVTYTYGPNSTTLFTIQNNLTSIVQKTLDASGKTIQIIDADGNLIQYTYGSHGNPLAIQAGTYQISMNYDILGRQTQLHDPSAGVMNYQYDELGRLVSQTDAKNQNTSMQYDKLNRIIQKTIPEGSIQYFYDAPGHIGTLSKVINYNGQECEYLYDSIQRIIKKTEKKLLSSSDTYTFGYAYDNLGRLLTKSYPNGTQLSYFYTPNQYFSHINLGNQQIYSLNSMNIREQPLKENLLNGWKIVRTYDPYYGIPASVTYSAGTNFDVCYTYSIEPSGANMIWRRISPPGFVFNIMKHEEFSYDNMFRLTREEIPGQQTLTTTYDLMGNILQRTGVGTFSYDAQNRISSVNTFSGTFPPHVQDITYTSFHQPLSITEGSYAASFDYGPDLNRKIMEITWNAQPVRKVLYLDNYEVIITPQHTYEVCYVNGNSGLMGMAVSTDGGPPVMHYIHTDHSGSIVDVRDTSGNIIYRVNYDAWGRERNPVSWDNTPNPYTRPVWLIRGYTGHEHLPEFGLINMNGRLYDPLLCRMLSPDNFIQDATSTQGYNRYAYVYNNPLKYKEIDGEIPVIVIPIVIGALAGGYVGYQIGKAEGAEGWEMAGYVVSGGIIGGAAGFLGGAVGGAIAGANFAGAAALGAVAGGGVAGGLAGAGYAALAGNDVGEGAWKGAVSGAAGGFVGGAIGGGWGAFFGGATASGLGTALYGGTPEQIAINSVLGGLTGWGSYELSTYANYKFNYRGNLNYGGYRKVQALMGRANFWDGEASWYELKDGSVAQTKWRPFVKGINPREPVPGAIYESHSHPGGGQGFGFAGPVDLAEWQITGGDYNFKVYSSKYEYIYTRNQIKGLTIDQLGNWGSDGFVRTIETSKYSDFAENNHLNIGFNHYMLNINFYGIFFWR